MFSSSVEIWAILMRPESLGAGEKLVSAFRKSFESSQQRCVWTESPLRINDLRRLLDQMHFSSLRMVFTSGVRQRGDRILVDFGIWLRERESLEKKTEQFRPALLFLMYIFFFGLIVLHPPAPWALGLIAERCFGAVLVTLGRGGCERCG